MTRTNAERIIRMAERTEGFFDRDTERGLIEVAQGEGRAAERAMSLLVNRNIGIVYKAAKNSGTDEDYEDATSAGVQGFIGAVRAFDLESTGRLSTLATIMVRQAIRRHRFATARAIRLPEYVHINLSKLTRAYAILNKRNGGTPPSDAEIDEFNSWPSGTTAGLRGHHAVHMVSTSTPLNDTATMFLGDTLVSEKYNPEVDVLEASEAERVEAMLSKLSPRSRVIVEMTFGLDGNERTTAGPLAEMFGISKQRVSQILAKSLQELGVRNAGI